MSSAIDTVNIHKLFDVFIPPFNITESPHNWFVSYPKNRTQQIRIKEVLSQRFKMDCGVPQGSYFGHVSFLSYIFSFYGYVDDTELYFSVQLNSDFS